MPVQRRARLLLATAVLSLLAACGAATPPVDVTSTTTVPATTAATTPSTSSTPPTPTVSAQPAETSVRATGSDQQVSVTLALAGDVHFAERTASRLATDPATAFGVAAAELSRADLTMVNLETAITTRGTPEAKEFHFRAPPSALTALADAGIDVASMANNHAADYGTVGLQDTLHAIADTKFPVIGIGADAAQAYAPYTATVHGLRLAIFAATQYRDHTLQFFEAGPDKPGVASAWSDALVDGVRKASSEYDVVIVYVHWGTEQDSCPNDDQRELADRLAAAGATAVVGTHAHVLQGAGWRPDGTYVAYGLGNYLWWRSFDTTEDDSGVLTLSLAKGAVTAAGFAPAHLDDTGVPVPATGPAEDRIDRQWDAARQCAGLLPAPPAR